MIGALAMVGCVKDMDQPAHVQSDYLVIEAACTPATKTDMVQGQSAWEKGDKITVVYNGAAYEYVASAAGETTPVTVVFNNSFAVLMSGSYVYLCFS